MAKNVWVATHLVNKRIWVSLHKALLHPWKLTCPQKRDYFSREYIFQPLIFRGHSLVFRGVTLKSPTETTTTNPENLRGTLRHIGSEEYPTPTGTRKSTELIHRIRPQEILREPTHPGGWPGRTLVTLVDDLNQRGSLSKTQQNLLGNLLFFGWVVGWFMVLSLGLSWTHTWRFQRSSIALRLVREVGNPTCLSWFLPKTHQFR